MISYNIFRFQLLDITSVTSAAFQQPFSAAVFFSAAFFSSRFFSAAYFDGNTWKNACLFETTTGFCLKTIYSNYTFYIKNIFTCCNAVMQKNARRNPMFSEFFPIFLLILLFLKNKPYGLNQLPNTASYMQWLPHQPGLVQNFAVA